MKLYCMANALALLAAATSRFEVVHSFGVVSDSLFGASRRVVPSSTTTTRLFLENGPSTITMPALSSTMKEGRVVSWLKSEGDPIEAGEAIMVVESDKADMDVEAFEDGFLAKIIVGEGEMAPVGEAVALIADSESGIDSAVASFSGGPGAAATGPAASAGLAPALVNGDSVAAGIPDVEFSRIDMPALSSTMKEGKVVSWLKSEGDEISAGEAIMVVESDKADMDVEAFEDGYLAAIVTGEGESCEVGSPVALIAANEADVPVLQAYGASLSGAAPPPAVEAAVASTAAPPATAAQSPPAEFSRIDMPALSSTMKEGKVVSWLKSEGDEISAGEPIMVVESDKADMDVEAFEDGYLAAIVTGEGESCEVGAPVALIAENEADVPALKAYSATLSGAGPVPPVAASAAAAPKPPSAPAAAPPPPAAVTAASGGRVTASPLARKKAEELGVDLSAVKGTGPKGRVTATDVEAAAAGGVSSATAQPVSASTSSPAASAAKPVWKPAPGVVAATPTARALAKKAKIDLSTIAGTGQFGRITADDVRAATGEKQPQLERKGTAVASVAVELPDGLVPMTGMQRAVSNNMVATLSTPEFRVSREIYMDDFDELYQKLKPKGVTVSAMLARAVALAIERHPIINSAYNDADGGTIQYKKDVNIAMAVAIDGGLITPTLMYANERTVVELAENWKELVGKAKSGTLSPAEYTTGTFTISNMGMFGVRDFGAILPMGQGGILAIGATRDCIVPDDRAVLGMRKAKVVTVTLTCDHRQIYGADAALFLRELANIMERELDRVAA